MSHSKEELQRASLAVQHELATLASTHEMLQDLAANWRSNPRDQALSNALLNAFLLAARNLLAFLYSHNPRPSDIIAEDFFDDPNGWQENRKVPEPELASGELRNQISKRLAHLTWDRAEGTRPLWGAFTIAWNIGLTMQSFLELADEEEIRPELTQDVAVFMVRLQAYMDQWGGMPDNLAPTTELIGFDDLEYFRGISDFECES